MRQLEPVFDEFKAGVVAGLGASQLTALASELDQCVVIAGEFPLPVSTEILRLLDDEEFLKQPSSWLLARLLSDEWQYFPEEKKPELTRKLQASFGRFSDFLGAFVIAEALAKHLDPRDALSRFRELYAGTQPPARALVAIGLRELTLRSNDQALRVQIVQLLNHMSNDSSADVRKEATLVLRKMNPGRTN